jgi:NAD+ kinase
VTASKYPFPTVCAEQHSTDWFLSISRTLKWNERERQKSFVVVEEDAPPRVRKNKRRPIDATPPVPAADNAPEEDEEDELSEEEEKFDIDDSAPEAAASSNGAGITDVDRGTGVEKTRKLTLSNPKRTSSRSHSPAQTSGSLSPPPSGVVSPNRYATRPPHPPFVTGRHVGFDVPSSPSSTSSDSLILDATHEGTRDNIRSPCYQGAKSRIPKDRDFDFDHIKTPTAGHHGHHRTRSATLSEPRVFAVRGQDESDSAASDADS